MKSKPHVALLVETTRQYGRDLLKGIALYLKGRGPWSIFMEERDVGDPLPDWIRAWKGDGIIARINSEDMACRLLSTGVPVVNAQRSESSIRMPSVCEDDFKLCQLALRHFVDHRFRNFGYFGSPDVALSRCRGEHFAEVVQAAGLEPCAVYNAPHRPRRAWEQEQEAVSAWLKSLPTPMAILAVDDMRGLQLLNACRGIDLMVPEQCAVLAVDNQVMMCELSDPPLSSIDQDGERAGYEAAAMLDRLMRGGPAPPPERAAQIGASAWDGRRVMIPPRGVVARSSTDSMGIEDADIAKALRFIRKHACERIAIGDVATHACLSRRVLQRRFKKLLGHSPLEEIFSVQMERIQKMLVETDLKLHAIAPRAGFIYVGHMSAFFKERSGMTCGEYREKARAERRCRHGLEEGSVSHTVAVPQLTT